MAFASLLTVAPLVRFKTTTKAYLESKPFEDSKSLITQICHHFYNLGWVGGSGGSITLKVHDDSIPKFNQSILMSPGKQKEQMFTDDMYVLSPNRSVVHTPSPKPYSHKPPKCSDCAPLFMKVYQMGLDWSSPTHGPMKSIQGASRKSEHRALYAKAGTSDLNHKEPVPRCIVLDIEGTTTPISFVFDVLFPYARDNVGKHLSSTYETTETQDDIKLLRAQIQEDIENSVGAVPVPSENEGKKEVISALVANVEAMIKADRKIPALKQLQGHIWRTGFQNNELEGVVFEDVPQALERWNASGIKVYIYSSGSRLAQRLIFGNTKYGDLRKYLCGFFDTAVGNKRQTKSYVEISESIGVDDPSEILFLTDVYQEAIAAKEAGLQVIISVRPGNGPLPDNHGFKTINSFSEI